MKDLSVDFLLFFYILLHSFFFPKTNVIVTMTHLGGDSMDSFHYHTFYYSLNMYVSQQIKEIRESLDMTQADVAIRLGISRQAYGKIENNITHITVDLLEQLCNIFKVSITEFFPVHLLNHK